MIDVAGTSRIGRTSGRIEAAPIAFLRRLDWVLLFAAAALVGYGLWVVAGITRFDVPGDEDYYVLRQGIAAVIGVVGLVAATLLPLDLVRRQWRLVYGMTLGLMVVVFAAAEAIRGSPT